MINYLDSRKNFYSQYGEDGIIESIFNKIDHVCPKQKLCVEFGAWDGKYFKYFLTCKGC